jgi:hypothetical protein
MSSLILSGVVTIGVILLAIWRRDWNLVIGTSWVVGLALLCLSISIALWLHYLTYGWSLLFVMAVGYLWGGYGIRIVTTFFKKLKIFT